MSDISIDERVKNFCENVWGWREPSETILQQANEAMHINRNRLKTGDIAVYFDLISSERLSELLQKAREDESSNRGRIYEQLIKFGTPEESALLESNQNRVLAASRGIQYLESIGDADIDVHRVMENAEVRKVCDDMNAVVAVIQDKTPVIIFAEMNREFQAFSTMSEQEQDTNAVYRAIGGTEMVRLALASGSEVIMDGYSLSKANSEDDGDGAKQVRHAELIERPELRKLALIHAEVIKRGGTDIHISPDINQQEVVVEARIHRRIVKLKKTFQLTRKEYQAIKTFLLNSSGAVKDGQECKRDADGRYTYSVNSKRVDVRAGFVALGTDERLTNNLVLIRLRLLPKERGAIHLADKGMPKHIVDHLRDAMFNDSGLILVVGPTGAGKSTTMLGCVELDRELWGDTKSRISIEIPVEREVPGINQVQAKVLPNETLEEAFKTYLGSFVRLDPDFMVMGEIRDRETAQMAAQQSVTGHKTLATLHANNTEEAIERLIILSEDESLRHLVIGACQTIIAQRLFPKVCDKCSIQRPLSNIEHRRIKHMKEIGTISGDVDLITVRDIHKEGCESCNYEGTIGVVPAFEVLDVTNEVKEIVLSSDSTRLGEIKKLRVATMESMAIEHIKRGHTPISSLFLL